MIRRSKGTLVGGAAGAVAFLQVEVDGEVEGQRVDDAGAELLTALKRYLPSEAIPVTVEPDAKGVVADLAVQLLSAGIISEVAQVLRDWFKRRPKDSAVKVVDADGNVVVEVTGTNVGDDVLVAALQRLADKPAD
ncbi:effector-associated constant component EACC1 [Cellulomonas sp. URHB0016]